jgi:hypothetical protein
MFAGIADPQKYSGKDELAQEPVGFRIVGTERL